MLSDISDPFAEWLEFSVFLLALIGSFVYLPTEFNLQVLRLLECKMAAPVQSPSALTGNAVLTWMYKDGY